MDQFAWLKGGWDFEQLMLIGTLAAIIFGIFMVVYSTLKFFWNCIAWAARAILRWIISYRQRSEMKRKLKRKEQFLTEISDYISEGIDQLLDRKKIDKEGAQELYHFYACNMGLWDFIPRRVFAQHPLDQIDVIENILTRMSDEQLVKLKPETLTRLRNRGFNIPENLLPKETKAGVKSDDYDLEKELRTLYA